MWLLFQSLIIFAVFASNIHWGWAANTYAVGILAWLAPLLLKADGVGPSVSALMIP